MNQTKIEIGILPIKVGKKIVSKFSKKKLKLNSNESIPSKPKISPIL